MIELWDGIQWTKSGCWGAEHAVFDSLNEAEDALAHLRELYPNTQFRVGAIFAPLQQPGE